MIINRQELEEALAKVKPGLESGKEYIEQMKHVMFSGDDAVTYNDHIAIFQPFQTDFKTSVRFDDLMKAVTTTFSGKEELEVTFDEEKGQLVLKAGKAKVGLSTIVENEVDEMVDSVVNQFPKDEKDWVPLPEDFIYGARLCMFAASSNMMAGHLTCLHIEAEGLIATDNYRISWYEFDDGQSFNFSNEGAFLIYAQDVKELVEFPVTEAYVADSWCHFRTADDLVFSVKKVLDKPLDFVKQIFEKDDKWVEVTFSDELKDKIEGMLFLSDGETTLDKQIDVVMEDNKLFCTAKNKRGWIEQEIDIEYTGEPKTLCLNPIFFAQVLDKTTTALVGDQKSILKSGTFKHVLIHKFRG